MARGDPAPCRNPARGTGSRCRWSVVELAVACCGAAPREDPPLTRGRRTGWPRRPPGRAPAARAASAGDRGPRARFGLAVGEQPDHRRHAEPAACFSRAQAISARGCWSRGPLPCLLGHGCCLPGCATRNLAGQPHSRKLLVRNIDCRQDRRILGVMPEGPSAMWGDFVVITSRPPGSGRSSSLNCPGLSYRAQRPTGRRAARRHR